MSFTPFRGIYAAAATPMLLDLSCNYDKLAGHYRDLIARGCTGIILLGTTGEGPSFSIEERKKAIQTMIPMGIDPLRCIVGVACCAVVEAVELIQQAANLRYSAAMIAPPFYFKGVSDDGVIAYYREIIRKAPGIKVILYHIPQFSGVPITLPIIQTLSEEFPDVVIGIKESEGNLDLTRAILRQYPGFKVFVGNETQISEAIEAGAAGAISGLANIFPELICRLYEGQGRQADVERIIESLQGYPLFPALKSLLESRKGASWHAMRPPLIPLDEVRRMALSDALKDL
ncbi:MAG: dihydrodipicolinate synthase family protein [Parachlamydia sp.]|nr:dihydrodipicolinate synthase family protein [Parachlamydia sp.]